MFTQPVDPTEEAHVSKPVVQLTVAAQEEGITVLRIHIFSRPSVTFSVLIQRTSGDCDVEVVYLMDFSV